MVFRANRRLYWRESSFLEQEKIMPSIYLVIDVQPGFYAADDKNLRRNIQEKLKKAVAEK